MMMFFGRQRMQKPELQRLSSDESYSSTTSLSKTHHRRTSFDGWSSISIGSGSPNSDVSLNSSSTMATDPLSATWSSSGSYALSHHVDVDTKECSLKSKIRRTDTGFDGEADKSMCVIELLRQLSFSPSRKTKKRTDTADTEASSSTDSFDSHHEDAGPIGLDLDHIEELRRGSPSPLVGLQYLPEENMYI